MQPIGTNHNDTRGVMSQESIDTDHNDTRGVMSQECIDIDNDDTRGVMSQESIDTDPSNTRGTEHNLNNTNEASGDSNKEKYFGDGEEMNDQYFGGRNNENWNDVDYYEDYWKDEYYDDYNEVEYYDDKCDCSYYGDGVDEITLNNIKYVLLDLVKATMRKEKVLEQPKTFLLSVLGLCSENQRQELMKIHIEGNTPLSTCCEVGNLDLAKFLVENCNADVDSFSLMWAVYNSQKELLLYLLQQNADIGVCFDNHYSLLMLALGIKPDDILILLKKGEASRDLAYIDSKLSNTLRYPNVYFISSTKIVEILIKYGIVKKLSNTNLFRCLAHCIDKEQTELFSMILEAIDEINNIRDENGCSILGYAIKMSKLQVVKKLISKGADINNTKIMKYVKCDEIESQTLQSIVNHRWHSLLDSNKSNEELNIDSQVYIHPIVYCASTESRNVRYSFIVYDKKISQIEMLIYLMKLQQIDLEVRLDAVEMLGAHYTIARYLEWDKSCQFASKCWNLTSLVRSRMCRYRHQVMGSCSDDSLDHENGNENVSSDTDGEVPDADRLFSDGKNMDQNNKMTIEGEVDIQENSDPTASNIKEHSPVNSIDGSVKINISSISNPADSNSNNSNPADSHSDDLNPADRSRSNSVVSDDGYNDDSVYSDSDMSEEEYGHPYIDFDNESNRVHDIFGLLNSLDRKIGQKKINPLPRSVFKNKLELCSYAELESLKPENAIDIATQTTLLYERLIGYESGSTIKAFLKLGNLYKQNGDKEQYLAIMIYIIVCFRDMTNYPNRYLNIMRNLAFIVFHKKDSYKLDICTEIMITKLFYMTNICETGPHREFSFLLSAIDKIRLYEKTEDELLDFNSLLRVVVKLDSRDEFGQSHLHYAALLKKGNSSYNLNNYDSDEEADHGWDISSDDWMLLAFNGGSLSLTNLFLDYGVNPNTYDNEGMTPLHAVYKVLTESESLRSESRKIVESLVEAGGHFDCIDAYGKTAIDYSQNTSSPLCPVASRSLQCLASCVIIENNLNYEGQIPQNLIEFVQIHGKRGTKEEKPKSNFIHKDKYKCIFVMQ